MMTMMLQKEGEGEAPQRSFPFCLPYLSVAAGRQCFEKVDVSKSEMRSFCRDSAVNEPD